MNLCHLSRIKPHSEPSEQKCENWDPLTSPVDLIFFSSSLSGQEKSPNSSHLCQNLQCLSSQSRDVSTRGLSWRALVLPTLWVSQRDTGLLFSSLLGLTAWGVPLLRAQPYCVCWKRHRTALSGVITASNQGCTGSGVRRIYCSAEHQLGGQDTSKE